MGMWIRVFKIEISIEIYLVEPTEEFSKVYTMKTTQKLLKTVLLLLNAIDAGHQNCLLSHKQRTTFNTQECIPVGLNRGLLFFHDLYFTDICNSNI